jgi:cytidylate kinase
MIQIAIDGPSGAGKSTLAKALAAKLGIVYVDTGALYRTIGYYVRAKNTDPKDEAAVARLLPEITIELKYENGTQKVLLCGEDLGDRIRTPEMSMYASAVSAIPAVRAFLLDTQRSIAKTNSVIMDGRDIGTVILPDADVKIFLTASNECRARRRTDELNAKGMPASYEDVLADMIERDRADSTRDVAPCVAAPDATTFDNSWMTPDECTEGLVRLIAEKTGKEFRA